MEGTSKHFDKCNTSKQLTSPNKSKQNGMAKQKNRHLNNAICIMVHAKTVNHEFWIECIRTTRVILNKAPLEDIGDVAPLEKLYRG